MRTRELMVYKDFEDGQLLDNMTFLIEHCQDMSCDKNKDNLITLFYDCIHRLINGSRHSAAYFTCHTIAVFIVHQKICQITVPKITVEAVSARQLYQPVDAIVK